jgi:hypothetical protein
LRCLQPGQRVSDVDRAFFAVGLSDFTARPDYGVEYPLKRAVQKLELSLFSFSRPRQEATAATSVAAAEVHVTAMFAARAETPAALVKVRLRPVRFGRAELGAAHALLTDSVAVMAAAIATALTMFEQLLIG